MKNPYSIGIKLYNDSFVPVLKSDEVICKGFVLTTVRDNQKKAIIELYEGNSDKCINNEYLGKLVIPINRATEKGEPAIEVNLRQDEEGILYAKAWDTNSSEESEIQIEHSHSKTILRETMNDRPAADTDSGSTQISNYSFDDNKEKKNILPLVLVIVAGILVLALLGTGIFFGVKTVSAMIKERKEREKTEMVLTDTEKEEEADTKKTEDIEKEEPVVDEKKEDEEEKEVILETEKEVVNKTEDIVKKDDTDKKSITGMKEPEGKRHYVRWGENLWDICIRYYGDPWYYPALAEYNPSIRSPRRIYAGTYIVIPKKSKLKRWEFID